MKLKTKIFSGVAAAAAAGAVVVGLTAGPSGAAQGDGTSSNSATPAAYTYPANGAYLGATPDNPVYWGCINKANSGLVGGRFYEFAGKDAAGALARYPGCNSWALGAAWFKDGSPALHALPESTRVSAPGLAIDGAPGLSGNGGSGGWGWDSTANAPITGLKVGASLPLTVTALQTSPAADASITLSWNPDDFSFVSNGDTSATCAVVPNASGVETCSYTDFAHSSKGDSFVFKALAANPTAVVTATVTVGTQQATATFPISILK
ncbi:MAG TPA: hypothetical protein VHX59_17280 [Mycobacteriales bacterium]|jgi:hypothetical protein|nr:hypothetical protein [Mycobacteriales bacterium]